MHALVWALGWLLGYYLLASCGVYVLPESIARTTTLPQYLAMVQIVSILLGASALLFATRSDIGLRTAFFPDLARGRSFLPPPLIYSVLLGPLVFLAAYGLGMHLAFDTLLSELAARGPRAVQAQTGELGRTARLDTLVTIFPFTVVLAPLGEELLFRGGIYGGIQGFVDTFQSKATPPESPPPSLAVAGLPARVPLRATRLGKWLFHSGFALLGSSLCFGLMHADTAGGMGIVRVTSASVLGLSCALARAGSGSLLAPLALHMTYNLISLASLRGWLVFSGFPTKYTIPTALVPLSLMLAAVALCHFVARRSRDQSRPAH